MRAASTALLLLLPMAAACHAHGPCGRYLPAAEGDTWSYRLQNGVVETARVSAVSTTGATLELRTLDSSGYGPSSSFELSCRGEVDFRTATNGTGDVIASHGALPAPDKLAPGAAWRGETRSALVVAIPIHVDMTPGAPKVPQPVGTPIRVLDVVTSENRIDHEEDVEVPAGSFHALRVESDLRTMRLGSPGSFPSRRLVWLARDVGPVKIEVDRTLPGGTIESDVRELTAYVVR